MSANLFMAEKYGYVAVFYLIRIYKNYKIAYERSNAQLI